MANATNVVLWAVLCLSQLVYVFVAFRKLANPNPQDVLTTTFPLLLIIALIHVAGTIWWRQRALVRPIQSMEMDLSTPGGQAQAFVPFILNLVLSQSVSIYGLVLTLLSDETAYVLGFVSVGLALMYIHRPFAGDLENPNRGAKDDFRPPPIA